ncbi:MAG: hypothetical protein KGH99_06615, partial [Thaumarchaeota archaeon]|nr:hypothetical protein [Nitrososphaerota archaeon]
NGQVRDSDFDNMLQNLSGHKITGNTIPYWLKNAASWWFEGKIDDTTFLNLIDYLISNKLIS